MLSSSRNFARNHSRYFLLRCFENTATETIQRQDDSDHHGDHITIPDTSVKASRRYVDCRYASQMRLFHATSRREIVPLVAAAVLIGVVGRYSYRALQRMDEEHEDYLDALEAYEEEYGPVTDESTSSMPLGTLGIDFGSESVRIAFLARGTRTEPKIVENREGDRETPTYVELEYDGDDERMDRIKGISSLGRLAKGKYHERRSRNEHERILKPRDLLYANDVRAHAAVHEVLLDATRQALEKVVGPRRDEKSSSTLFSISDPDLYNVNAVFTFSSSLSNNVPLPSSSTEESYRSLLKSFFDNEDGSQNNLYLVTEAWAAVVGAEHYSMIPEGDGPVMVIDVGGNSIDISLVSGEDECTTVSFPGLGGNILVDAMARLLDNTIQTKLSNSISSLLETDDMARQRMYDAAESTVKELSKKSRSEVSLPFLTVDSKSSQPLHLNSGFSRLVLNSEVESMVGIKVKELTSSSELSLPVSKAMKFPETLKDVIASMCLRLFEDSQKGPLELRSILITGGGSRSPIHLTAIKEAITIFGGEQFVDEKVVVPPGELVEEITAIGASLTIRKR